MFHVVNLSGFSAEKLVFILAAAIGAAQAAKQQYADAHGDEHCEESSDREE